MTDTRAIAIVIGRAGSKGLPGKNALPLGGEPMICHSIRAAQRARTVTRVVVSTDGADIAAAAAATGVTVVDRPAALATDTAPVDAAVRHAAEAAGGDEPVVVILYANVPVRPDGLVDRAVRELIATGADSVQSYARVGKHHPYWMVTLDDAGRVAPFHPNTIDRRQDLPEVLLPDGGVIAVTRAALLAAAATPKNPHAFLGRDRRGIRTDEDAVIDIDGPADLLRAEARLARELAGETAR